MGWLDSGECARWGGLKIGALSVGIFLMHSPQRDSLTFCVMYENKGFWVSMFMQFCQLASWKGLSWWEKERKKKKQRGEWRTSPGRVPLKIGSKLPIPALLSSAKLCLCSPFQGTPGVLASIRCAQNALRCHLFKHSEPLANRDKPLFIKPLILAARMTTWLALKGALKSFIGMGGGNLYREGDSSLSRRELWRMNSEARWGTVSSRGLMRGRDRLHVWQIERARKERGSVWLGNNGWEGASGWQREQTEERWQRSGDQMRARVAGTMNECGMSGWEYCDQVTAWANEQIAEQTSGWRLRVCVRLWRSRGLPAHVCKRRARSEWMSEAPRKRLSERVMGVSDGCVDRKCQL